MEDEYMFDRSISLAMTAIVGFAAFFLPGQQGKGWKFPVQQLEQQVAQAESKAPAQSSPAVAEEAPKPLESPQPPQASSYDFASRDCCDQLEKRLSKLEDRVTSLEKRCKCNQAAVSEATSTVVPNGTVTYGQPIYSDPVVYYEQPYFGSGGGCSNGQCGTGSCANGSCGPVRTILRNQPVRQFIQR